MSWTDTNLWIRYFKRAQEILGAEITHLDKHDPVRRRFKPGRLDECAEYVTAIGNREDVRWLFGRVSGLGVDFAIRHYREVRAWPNSITWYFAPEFLERPDNIEMICHLFDVGNAELRPFYSYAETKALVSTKKKQTGAVDVQAELLGVFWLTYFDSR